jgi:hypothetical protein
MASKAEGIAERYLDFALLSLVKGHIQSRIKVRVVVEW